MPAHTKELHRTRDASAGCGQRYWARTTAFFPHPVWYSESPRRMRLTATF